MCYIASLYWYELTIHEKKKYSAQYIVEKRNTELIYCKYIFYLPPQMLPCGVTSNLLLWALKNLPLS